MMTGVPTSSGRLSSDAEAKNASMSTCSTVHPVSSGGCSAPRCGSAYWRRLIGGPGPPSAAGEDVHGGAELSEEAEVGVTAGDLLELEQGDAVGVGVDQRRRHEVAEQPHAVDVLDDEAGLLDEGLQRGGVEAAWQ